MVKSDIIAFQNLLRRCQGSIVMQAGWGFKILSYKIRHYALQNTECRRVRSRIKILADGLEPSIRDTLKIWVLGDE